jgi:ubiquinone/menaquinone biosynthesis C-methylase UbiE
MRVIDVNFDPKELLRAGYDAIASRYADWAAAVDSPAMEFVCKLSSRIPAGSDVLDIGCGSGVFARELSQRHQVTGIDLSAVQIELARRNVPEATFINADVRELELAPASFDAAVALYLLLHVPRREHAAILAKIAAWLRPGGLFLATMGAGKGEAVEEWLGVQLLMGCRNEPPPCSRGRSSAVEGRRHRAARARTRSRAVSLGVRTEAG